MLAHQNLAQEQTNRAARWLSRGVSSLPRIAESSHESIELRRRARAINAFENDKLTCAVRHAVLLHQSPLAGRSVAYTLAQVLPVVLSIPLRLSLVVAICTAFVACKRIPVTANTESKGAPSASARDVLCLEQPDGCLYCLGREGESGFIDPDQSRPQVCDPKDEDACVEFCSALVPTCALPWSQEPRCVLDSELAFHRALFNRDTADRPDVVLPGRVVDESGHRLEGVHVDIWVSRGTRLTPIGEETSGKDGTFRIHLRSGPWTYVLRLSHAGLASEIVDRLTADRLPPGAAAAPRTFRMGPEMVLRGKVMDGDSGAPVADALVQAVRNPEDQVDVSSSRTGEDGSFSLGGLESRRYALRISKFGWTPALHKTQVTAPGARVQIKLARATAIRGIVRDSEGNPEPSATIAAVLADVPGAPNPPIFWASDSRGQFAQDRFAPGTYYLWARRGDMLVYPPEKIEVESGSEAAVDLHMTHKGARVTGQVVASPGSRLSSDLRVVLVSRPPSLAFPRPAVGRLDGEGRFNLVGVLPGRYEIRIRDAGRVTSVTGGPTEVEVPIDPATTVSVKEPLTVRSRVGE